MKRIVALDPGGTTGAVTWQGNDLFDWYHFGPQDHHEELFEALISFAPDVIICESFEFRKAEGWREGINLISREYIGVAKLFGQLHTTPVVLQTAGLAKGFIPDKAVNGMEANAKLKVMGLYKPGMKHANDAMRHLIYYMVKGPMKRVDLIESWKELR